MGARMQTCTTTIYLSRSLLSQTFDVVCMYVCMHVCRQPGHVLRKSRCDGHFAPQGPLDSPKRSTLNMMIPGSLFSRHVQKEPTTCLVSFFFFKKAPLKCHHSTCKSRRGRSDLETMFHVSVTAPVNTSDKFSPPSVPPGRNRNLIIFDTLISTYCPTGRMEPFKAAANQEKSIYIHSQGRRLNPTGYEILASSGVETLQHARWAYTSKDITA